MKKYLILLCAAMALIGCQQGSEDVNEPAGADRTGTGATNNQSDTTTTP